MSEKFIKLYENSVKTDEMLWKYLCDCVGKSYKFTNPEGEEFYIVVKYFRGFTEIGIEQINVRGVDEFNEWDVEEFYEIIKDSVEIL